MATPIYNFQATPEENLRILLNEQKIDGQTAAKPNGWEPFPVLAAKAIFNAEQKSEAAAALSEGVALTSLIGSPSSLENVVAPVNSTREVKTGTLAGEDVTITRWSLTAGTHVTDEVSWVLSLAVPGNTWVRVP